MTTREIGARQQSEADYPLTAMSRLLEPLRFPNGATLPNRIVLAAMTNLQSHEDGSLAEAELTWLKARAEGGFGTITTCASHVARDGQGWPGELGCFEDALLPGLMRLASELGQAGAVTLVQLFHAGIRADKELIRQTPWGPSALPALECRAGTEAEILRVIEDFAEAALRAERAGMTGVEIHGAHGYLLCQFLSATQNQRTDVWGGPFENRSRLIRSVLRRVRAVVSRRFVVGVRLSPENFGNAQGLDLDESVDLARHLVEEGADFIHLSLWKTQQMTAKRPQEHALPIFRRALPASVPLVVAGSLWSREDAEQMLDLGADAVALGRAAILNPSWPLCVAKAGEAPRRPPIKAEELHARGVSDTFVNYLTRWKNLVEL